MNKRIGIGLILGMSLLFCAGIYWKQEARYRVEASTEMMKQEENATDSIIAISTGQSGTQPTESAPASTTMPSGTPESTPDITGEPQATGTPQSTNGPNATATPWSTNVPKATKAPGSATKTDRPGWHKTAKGKKYYIKANGKRAKGYKTIDGAGYFFNKNGYAITSQWKYVKINGKKYKLYFGKNGKRKLDVTKQLKQNTYFRIEVNLSKNMVMIYAKDGNKGYTIPVKAMVCSAGMPGHRTITGNYSRLSRAGSWHVLRYNSVGQYCTRISGPYLFHSVVYTRYGDKYSLQKKEYNKLGKSASHGCIRLQVADAKWIYDRAYRCSVSLYYDKSAKYPLKKPKAKKIGKSAGGRYYDPTDSKVKEYTRSKSKKCL